MPTTCNENNPITADKKSRDGILIDKNNIRTTKARRINQPIRMYDMALGTDIVALLLMR